MILATELKTGDWVMPPKHERKWLKTPMEILEKRPSTFDKGGEWLWFKAEYKSPYGDRISTMNFKVRPATKMENPFKKEDREVIEL